MLLDATAVLLDATAVLLGVGLAAAGFVVVIVVSATVLRLIGFVLGDGEATSGDEPAEEDAPPAGDATPSEPGGAAPGTPDTG